MDKNSNTWREIMDLSKNNPKQMDDSSMLRSLGLDEETMNKIEEDTLESAKEQIKVRVSFMNTSSNEDPKHKYIDEIPLVR